MLTSVRKMLTPVTISRNARTQMVLINAFVKKGIKLSKLQSRQKEISALI